MDIIYSVSEIEQSTVVDFGLSYVAFFVFVNNVFNSVLLSAHIKKYLSRYTNLSTYLSLYPFVFGLYSPSSVVRRPSSSFTCESKAKCTF